MKRSALSALLLTLAAMLAVPAGAGAQEQEGEAETGGETEKERVRTVTIRPEVGALVLDGQRSWLGVRVDDLDRSAADSLGLDEVRGARVLGVNEESPASEAGLREDDVIVGFDGESVRSVAELVRLVRETPPGREVQLRVVRDGSTRTVAATIREREGGNVSFRGMPGMRNLRIHGLDDLPEGLSEERMERIRKRMERATEGREEAMRRLREHMGELHGFQEGDGAFRFHVGSGPRLGVRLESLTDQLAGYFGVGERGGVLVSSVQEGSAAESAGLRAGDVIVAFGDAEIEDVGDLMEAVHDAEAGPVTVTVVRRGEERSMTVELPDHRRERERRAPASWHDDPAAVPTVTPSPPTVGVRPVPASGAVAPSPDVAPAPPSAPVPAVPAPAPAPVPATASGVLIL